MQPLWMWRPVDHRPITAPWWSIARLEDYITGRSPIQFPRTLGAKRPVLHGFGQERHIFYVCPGQWLGVPAEDIAHSNHHVSVLLPSCSDKTVLNGMFMYAINSKRARKTHANSTVCCCHAVPLHLVLAVDTTPWPSSPPPFILLQFLGGQICLLLTAPSCC